MFIGRGVGYVPFTAFMGYDNGVSRIMTFGGGNWDHPDATEFRVYTAPSYSETANTGLLRIYVPAAIAMEFWNHNSTNNAVATVAKLLTINPTASTGGANGFGSGLDFSAETATDGTNQTQALIASSWIDATNASRKAKLSLYAYDTAARLGFEIEASGTESKIGFHGVTPITRAVLATGAGATVDNVITALQNLGLVKQS
jgi:hypothetical protein